MRLKLRQVTAPSSRFQAVPVAENGELAGPPRIKALKPQGPPPETVSNRFETKLAKVDSALMGRVYEILDEEAKGGGASFEVFWTDGSNERLTSRPYRQEPVNPRFDPRNRALGLSRFRSHARSLRRRVHGQRRLS